MKYDVYSKGLYDTKLLIGFVEANSKKEALRIARSNVFVEEEVLGNVKNT